MRRAICEPMDCAVPLAAWNTTSSFIGSGRASPTLIPRSNAIQVFTCRSDQRHDRLRGMKITTLVSSLLPLILIAAGAQAQVTPDPYLWLEEVDSPRAMDWVR